MAHAVQCLAAGTAAIPGSAVNDGTCPLGCLFCCLSAEDVAALRSAHDFEDLIARALEAPGHAA